VSEIPRTYESPPAGADATGLEDYAVEAAAGERVGTVVAAIEHEGAPWLVVETGTPPVKRKRRGVALEQVVEVDHDALVVRVGLSREELESAPAFERSAEQEDGSAEAQRLTRPPTGVPRAGPTGDVAGPVDNSLWVVALAATLLGVLSALGIVIALSMKDVGDTGAWLALVIPVILIGIGAVAAYRLWRNPYEGGTG
jgi:hypothetical protein